ncbi:BON domain-containing protein [Phytohabitans sp. ZYX-F-186]|uniref:BON domain-containing protein n=1 Tax=Phytohabitans maris TaxID=3071409 RepID=A0ABU0ZW52_9ACTN|nr:BON domain-containing protein [Phytohabitans sp. ZYX-F-186]MDQ7911254.1 BON domain-containing protein [Phytohabitans sp. ZYX-F-186]
MMAPWPLPEDEPAGRPSRRPAPRRDNDKVLADRVVERLVRDGRTRPQSICVEVQNGVAILTGRVDTAELMAVAGGLAWQTPGIVDVCNALRPSDGDGPASG